MVAKGPEQDTFDNAFKRQWEFFLRHVVKDEPFRWGLLEGAKGVQLAEKGDRDPGKHAADRYARSKSVKPWRGLRFCGLWKNRAAPKQHRLNASPTWAEHLLVLTKQPMHFM